MEPSIYRMRNRHVLALCVMGLLALGAVMVQSASMNVSTKGDVLELLGGRQVEGDVKDVEGGYSVTDKQGVARRFDAAKVVKVERRSDRKWFLSKLATKHLWFVAFALLTFVTVGCLDYTRLAPAGVPPWRVPALWIVVAAALLCAAVLVPGLGKSVNGARRWIMLGAVQIQPSEVAKWSVVVFLAWWLSRRPLNLDKFFTGLLPTLVPIGVLCLLVVIEDFGTAALIGLCAFTMLLAGRVKLWHLAIVIPPALAAAFWFVRSEPYRWARTVSYLDPWAAPEKEGYHMVQSLLSFSSGGFLGRGLGNGVQKLGYLPEDTTDFIFAVICEELGIFGALMTIALYLGVVYVAWQIIKDKRADASNAFGRLLAFGIASMLGLQAAINVAVATVSVPTKGLSLPLVSAGGSGLVITCAALGILYSVARMATEAEGLVSPAAGNEEPAGAAQLPKPPRRPRRKPRVVNDRLWNEFTTAA
jgi:cell division protein FtsW